MLLSNSLTQESGDQGQHGQLALKALTILMGSGVIILAFVASDHSSWIHFFRTSSIGILTAGAFAFIGALLGFIFGIPRTVQGASSVVAGDANSNSAKSPNTAFLHNTNLEDISDWLTKILVGVSLTQLSSLPESLWGVAGQIAAGWGDGGHTQILSLATIIYYSTIGFLFAYLWTRLYFRDALAQLDAGAITNMVLRVDRSVSDLKEQEQKDAKALHLVGLQLNPNSDAPEIDKAELKESIIRSSSAIKSAIYQQAVNVRRGYWQTDKKRMALSIPIFEALVEGDNDNEYHYYHGQLGWALKDKEAPDWVAAEASLSKAIEHRGSWKEKGWLYYEANRALCRIKMLDDANHAHQVTKQGIISDLEVANNLPAEENFTLELLAVKEWMKREEVELGNVPK